MPVTSAQNRIDRTMFFPTPSLTIASFSRLLENIASPSFSLTARAAFGSQA
jgi:hypothetical protein